MKKAIKLHKAAFKSSAVANGDNRATEHETYSIRSLFY